MAFCIPEKESYILPCAKNKAKGPPPAWRLRSNSQKMCFSLGPIREWPGSWHCMDLETHYAAFLVCKPSAVASPLRAPWSPPILLLIPGHRTSRFSSFSRETFKAMGTSPNHCWERSVGNHERVRNAQSKEEQQRKRRNHCPSDVFISTRRGPQNFRNKDSQIVLSPYFYFQII